MSKMQIETLGDALPKEMMRVQHEILPMYELIGPAGALAAAMMRLDLSEATRAITEGDTIAMIRAYQSLKEYSL